MFPDLAADICEASRLLSGFPPTNSEWRLVPGSEHHAVDADGKIWTNAKGFWEQVEQRVEGKNGYSFVSINGRQRNVAHLVLEAFVGPRPYGCFACHFPDKTPSNNRLSNLRWATPAINSDDAKIHRAIERGITEEVLGDMYRMNEVGISVNKIAKFYGVSKFQVVECLKKVNSGKVPEPVIEDTCEASNAAAIIGRKGASNGGKARRNVLSKERMHEIAVLGGKARWAKRNA